MKTVERTTDYETREVTETLIVVDCCGSVRSPEDVHPVDAAGHDLTYCTECFVAEFDRYPEQDVSDIDDSDGPVAAVFEWVRTVTADDQDRTGVFILICLALVALWVLILFSLVIAGVSAG